MSPTHVSTSVVTAVGLIDGELDDSLLRDSPARNLSGEHRPSTTLKRRQAFVELCSEQNAELKMGKSYVLQS